MKNNKLPEEKSPLVILIQPAALHENLAALRKNLAQALAILLCTMLGMQPTHAQETNPSEVSVTANPQSGINSSSTSTTNQNAPTSSNAPASQNTQSRQSAPPRKSILQQANLFECPSCSKCIQQSVAWKSPVNRNPTAPSKPAVARHPDLRHTAHPRF